MTVFPLPNTDTSLLQKYKSVRAQSEAICAPLQPEDFVVQPIEDVSPPKWHLGHMTWFFENFILIENFPGYQIFDARLNYIFNSYYESQGPRILRSNRGNITRPGIDTILEYRRYVDRHMEELLQHPLSPEVQYFITIGLHHEQQHQELLIMDIKYILGTNPFFPVYQSTQSLNNQSQITQFPNLLTFHEGIYEIGHQGDGFCFDNELGAHQVFLHDFSIQDRLVTNGEYLEFMQSGGYEKFEHWLSEGWTWAKNLEVKAPLYWYEKDGVWCQYTLGGLREVDPNEPVTHVSYFEADAFARWRDMRLPTEFEWEVACKILHQVIPKDGNFLENNNLHPTIQQNNEDTQMLGNVWEWTGSAYLPYPNYPRLEGALGEYNGKFMANQMVLRGGSCATPISHIRPTYRNFFPTDKRWQFTGFRLATRN